MVYRITIILLLCLPWIKKANFLKVDDGDACSDAVLGGKHFCHGSKSEVPLTESCERLVLCLLVSTSV